MTQEEKNRGFTDPKRQRELVINGRHYGECPSSMIIELTGTPQLSFREKPYGYECIEETWDDQEGQILGKLPSETGVIVEEHAANLRIRKETVIKVLKEAFCSGLISRDGNGKSGDPYKYRKLKLN